MTTCEGALRTLRPASEAPSGPDLREVEYATLVECSTVANWLEVAGAIDVRPVNEELVEYLQELCGTPDNRDTPVCLDLPLSLPD